jgi:hypothetical protein
MGGTKQNGILKGGSEVLKPTYHRWDVKGQVLIIYTSKYVFEIQGLVQNCNIQ